jgi:hypothetical protein
MEELQAQAGLAGDRVAEQFRRWLGTVSQIWQPSATSTPAIPASRPASAPAGVDSPVGATTALRPPWMVGRRAPGPMTAARRSSRCRNGSICPTLLSRTNEAAVAGLGLGALRAGPESAYRRGCQERKPWETAPQYSDTVT